MHHACLRAPYVAWPLLSPSFSLLLMVVVSSGSAVVGEKYIISKERERENERKTES